MAKNILLFYDGTSNRFGDNLTNVVKTYAVSNHETQKALYVPGLGSIADKAEYSYLSRMYKKIIGLGFGFGLQEKVIVGYEYLMNEYETGDKIFIFGFSRGSYTAKVLAGLINACGLLEKGNDHHIQYAYDLYSNKKFRPDLFEKYKSRFARLRPEIHFMGLFDSVSSVGSVVRMRNLPYTSNVENVNHLRHALAIDEKRALFKQNSTFSKKDIKTIWFAGVHGDVGGGNPEMASAAAKVPLKWMIDEAVAHGLEIDQAKYDRYVISKDVRDYVEIDPLGAIHKNNFLTWGILELLPRYKTEYKPKKTIWYWPLFGRRKIPENSVIHNSVQLRMDDSSRKYKPSNLPDNYRVE